LSRLSILASLGAGQKASRKIKKTFFRFGVDGSAWSWLGLATMKNETNTMPTSNITTLSHNQIVRGSGFPDYTGQIKVGTCAGYYQEIGTDPQEGIARAKKQCHPLAWTNLECGCLTDDYSGKAKELADKRSAIAAAPEIEDGQLVEIEGIIYKARLTGHKYSDPIHFIPA